MAWSRVLRRHIAPHAGNTALISIPGAEGSALDDAKFCDFIHEAEAVGIDVQLLSTPALDIAFIQLQRVAEQLEVLEESNTIGGCPENLFFITHTALTTMYGDAPVDGWDAMKTFIQAH